MPGKSKLKSLIFGSHGRMGLLSSLMLYMLLTGIGFVFLYPLVNMFFNSTMSIYDLVNPLVNHVPETFYWENYARAFQVIGGFRTMALSILSVGGIAILQTAVSAVVAYGLAKYDFFGKPLVMGLIIATFLIPQQLLHIPTYIQHQRFGLTGTMWPIILPTMFGNGLRSAIFLLIFYQMFRLSPKSLNEAANLDGAGHFKTFWRINIPMATPAIVVCLIFSMVWHWNDTQTFNTYLGNNFRIATVALQRFREIYLNLYPFDMTNDPLLRMNRGVEMAGSIITIIPLIVFYFVIERKLVASIDQAGITGE